MTIQIPTKVPVPGFYYHYKHTDNAGEYDYAYEVLGTGCHTEDDCRTIDMHLVVYRPLYGSSVFKAGKFFYVRPLSIFLEDVIKDGVSMHRFTKITNEKSLNLLRAKREEMYGT